MKLKIETEMELTFESQSSLVYFLSICEIKIKANHLKRVFTVKVALKDSIMRNAFFIRPQSL